MDPQPETVSPVQTNGKPAAPAIVNQRRKEPGRAASPTASSAAATSQATPANQAALASRSNGDARVSIDPMRATDRYRLVVPYSPRF